MNDAQLDQLDAALKAKQNTAQGDGLNQPKRADTQEADPVDRTPASQDAPAPPQEQAKPAPQAATAPKANGTKGNGLIPLDAWKSIIMAIDMNPDWATLKHDWKQENRVENVIRLTDGGKAKFLEYLREKIGPTFPY